MKLRSIFATLVASSFLVGCGTLGGAVSGAGEDLSRAGNWIKNR